MAMDEEPGQAISMRCAVRSSQARSRRGAPRCVVLQSIGRECFQMWPFCATSTSAHLDGDRTWHDPPGKISNALCVHRVAVAYYAWVRSLSPTSCAAAGYCRTGQKDHPPFMPRPFRTTPKLLLSKRGRGRFVSPRGVVQARQTHQPPPALPAGPNPSRSMVCAQTHTPPSPLASRAPATSFPLYALLALLPGDSQSGNPQPMACHCLLGCGLACRRSPMGTAL